MATKKSTISDEQVRDIAYTLWLNDGRPEGSAEIHWFRALELASDKPAVSKAPVKKAAAKKAA